VARWNDGAVDNWATFVTGDWEYSVSSSPGCNASIPFTPLARSSAKDNLGAEAGEAATFAAYTSITFVDTDPESVGTASDASSGCTLTFNVTVEGDEVW
jgi:hypothetical protein